MDRKYNYQYAGDSMVIRTSYNEGNPAFYLDSSVVKLVADTNWLKVRSVAVWDTFNNFGIPGNSSNGHAAYLRKFAYSGNDISSINMQSEGYTYSHPPPYLEFTDTTTMTLTRAPQISTVLNDMENKYFGKEIRLLGYYIDDSLSLIDNFFYYGMNSVSYSVNSASIDNWYANIYGAAYHPVTETRLNGKSYRLGVLYKQANNFLQHKTDYILDSQNRIVHVKEYDASSGAVVEEIFYTYY